MPLRVTSFMLGPGVIPAPDLLREWTASANEIWRSSGPCGLSADRHRIQGIRRRSRGGSVMKKVWASDRLLLEQAHGSQGTCLATNYFDERWYLKRNPGIAASRYRFATPFHGPWITRKALAQFRVRPGLVPRAKPGCCVVGHEPIHFISLNTEKTRGVRREPRAALLPSAVRGTTT